MKCHYCGAEVFGDQKFCIFCGTRLEEKKETPVTASEPKEYAYENTAPASPAAAPVPAARPVSVRPAVVAPRLQLPVKRGLGKMFFLGILTLGIYPVVIWSRIVTELNLVASRYDGKRTMPYFAMCTLAPITLGIYPLVWIHNFCGRIGEELKRRGMDYKFGASTFWLWGVLGSLIIAGPFVFTHKLMKSMNLLNADYNAKG